MNEQTTKIRDLTSYYDVWWENPSDPRAGVFNALNRLVARRLPPGCGAQALDVGSGRGTITKLLLDQGYSVTGVEVNPSFVASLKKHYPLSTFVEADLRTFVPARRYEVVTIIEVLQNLEPSEIRALLRTLAKSAGSIHVTISNAASFHGRWVEFRRFKADFVNLYRSSELDGWLEEAGFKVTFRCGVGCITPVTLLSGFRLKLIPNVVASAANALLDPLLPRNCHLYYVEARSELLE